MPCVDHRFKLDLIHALTFRQAADHAYCSTAPAAGRPRAWRPAAEQHHQRTAQRGRQVRRPGVDGHHAVGDVEQGLEATQWQCGYFDGRRRRSHGRLELAQITGFRGRPAEQDLCVRHGLRHGLREGGPAVRRPGLDVVIGCTHPVPAHRPLVGRLQQHQRALCPVARPQPFVAVQLFALADIRGSGVHDGSRNR
ncbi:hypothetical protein SAMN05192579_102288 [Rhodanobacter glycinis]|uniref:Uncharacterized protein n=1 Tax=Rhodanobacter glycinis TaxID=582702 RepID=A0A1I3ZA94_9GAMM|nr:hypothetical protein SAMN05192579_102288 [Rhodanobacter glycinis]